MAVLNRAARRAAVAALALLLLTACGGAGPAGAPGRELTISAIPIAVAAAVATALG